MAQILVRNLDKRVVKKLKDRAKKAGRSLQAEVKMILEGASEEPRLDAATAWKLADEFQSRFKGRKFTDSVKLLREDRYGEDEVE